VSSEWAVKGIIVAAGAKHSSAIEVCSVDIALLFSFPLLPFQRPIFILFILSFSN
jgi:hypothetical protein